MFDGDKKNHGNYIKFLYYNKSHLFIQLYWQSYNMIDNELENKKELYKIYQNSILHDKINNK